MFEPWLSTGAALLLAAAAWIAATQRHKLAKTETALAEARERLSVLFDNAPDAYFWYDMGGVLVEGNRAATELVGYPRKELVGRSILELGILDPSDLERAAAVLQASFDGAVVSAREYRFRRKDGTEVPVEVRSFPATLAGQSVVLVTAHDLGERKRAEEMATGLGRMLEQSLNEVYVIDVATRRFIRVNRGARENLGYDMDELARLGPPDIVDPTLSRQMNDELNRLERGDDQALKTRTRLIRKDGSSYSAEVHIQRATLLERPVLEAFVLDTTERDQERRRLSESEQRLHEARRVARLGHWVWDIEADRIQWSDEVPDIVGAGPNEFDGRLSSWIERVHPDDREMVGEQAARIMESGGHGVFDHRVITSAGEIRYVQESGEYLEAGEDGKPRVLGTVLDITARKRAELSLVELNQQLENRVVERTADLERAVEEVESFSYTISHDLRQPLRALDGYVRFIAEDLSEQLNEETRGYLDRIISTVARMSAMIDAMLQLARMNRAELKLRETDLSAIAERVADELARANPEREVNVAIAPDIRALCDSDLAEILLRNLLGNAYKFTGKRDRADIRFGRRRNAAGAPEYYVSDNGSGFDMDFQSKLFAPFERLHREDEFPGTGVGLATSDRIVRRHGGRIRADGVPGEGAEFRFSFGPADAAAGY